MKKWLQIVQKYIFQVNVALFGVLFIYSLIYATPVAQLVKTLLAPSGEELTGRVPPRILAVAPNAIDLVNTGEIVARIIMYLAIAGLVITGVNIIYRAHIRKKYYMTNFVAMGIWMFITLGTGVMMIATVVPMMIDFANLPIDELNGIFGPGTNLSFPAMSAGDIVYYIIGLVLALVLLASCACVLMLFITKLKEHMAEKNAASVDENKTSLETVTEGE